MRKRTIKKSFYLSEEENKLLKEKCFSGFISESNFFRMCILNKEIKEKQVYLSSEKWTNL